ncbi:MAG: DUF5667 domain-containing protein, partial [Anaerolineae bacterium]
MIEFDRILDDAFSRLEAGESIDAILSWYPEHADALEPLLETAALGLYAYTYTEPASRTGMARGRQRFLSEAAMRAEKHRIRHRRDRWPTLRRDSGQTWLRPVSRWALAVTALLLLILTAGTTAVVASADSLPGNLLYPVKIAAEEARLVLTRAPEPRARLRMARAERRDQELTALLARQEAVRGDLLVSSLNEAEAALHELSRVPAEDRRQPLDTYVEFARAQAGRLEQVRVQAPPSQQPLLDTAAARYRELADLARTAQTNPDVLVPIPTRVPLPLPTMTPTEGQPTPSPTQQVVPAVSATSLAPSRPTATATDPVRPATPVPTATSTRSLRPQTPANAATVPATARPALATRNLRPTRTPTSRPSTRPVTAIPFQTPMRRPTPTPTRWPTRTPTQLPGHDVTPVVTPLPNVPTPTSTARATPTPWAVPVPIVTPTATDQPHTRPTPTPTTVRLKPSPTATRHREPSPTPTH